MNSRSLLPPAYLLPAWSHHQLIQLGRNEQRRQHARFTSHQASLESSRAPPEDPSGPKIYGIIEGQSGPQPVLTYASRRQHRYERGNEEIKRRLLEKQTRTAQGTNRGSSRDLKENDARLIARYVKDQTIKSTKSAERGSFGRGFPLNSNTLRMFADLKAGEEETTPKPSETKQPAPLDHNAFESLDGHLYPPAKRRMPLVQLAQASKLEGLRRSKNDQSRLPAVKTLKSFKSVVLPAAAPSQSQSDSAWRTKNSTIGASDSQLPQKSLLEELFPEQAAKTNGIQATANAVSQQLEPQELPMPAVDNLQDDSILRPKRIKLRSVVTDSDQPSRPVPALLILENALPNLVEADFRRVSPKGKHIEDWRSTFDPMAIIPDRTQTTGECTGRYYLVFGNLGHAKAWKTRVGLLHRIVKSHAANSVVAPLIPKKGFTSQGEDIGETLREYSIFSHGIEPVMKLHSDPQADPNLAEELKMVLARLKPSNNLFQPGRSVILWIDGWTVGTSQVIKKMLAIDGRLRNMPWGDSGYENILEDYHNQIPLVRDKDPDPTSTSNTGPRKWLITLRDEAEARRFVRSWHMRPFPAWLQYKKDDHDEPWPLVRTELIW